jgi:hypothetical protein
MTISRRRVLAALATAGGAGALTGSATSALLRDVEQDSLGLTTGLVDVLVEYWEHSADPIDLSAPDGVVDGPHVTLPISTLDEVESGRALLRISLPQGEGPNNPASLWLKGDCPDATTLGEFLQVTLSYATADGTPTTEIASGSLRMVANALRTGLRLDGDPTTEDIDCLTDEVFVAIEYDLGAYVGTETVALPLSLVATQCRNADPSISPFPADSIDPVCQPAYNCDCCWTIGKVEVDAAFQRGRTYAFDEGLAGYAIRVTDTDGASGVAFEVVATADDVAPLPLCDVAVKGGPPDVHYSRRENEFGFDTSVLGGAVDGLIYAPENPNSGGRYGISYVLVSVCAPELADGGCPADVASEAASVGDQKPPGKSDTGPDADTTRGGQK